jgi:hypothetical protein
MHRSPENTGALFQVASQFNLLEMVFDEELRQRAERPVLERNDPDLPVRRGELDGQHLDRHMLGGESHDVGRDDRKKASIRRQSGPHIYGVGIDRRARRFEPARIIFRVPVFAVWFGLTTLTAAWESFEALSASERREFLRWLKELAPAPTHRGGRAIISASGAGCNDLK